MKKHQMFRSYNLSNFYFQNNFTSFLMYRLSVPVLGKLNNLNHFD